MSTLSTLTDLPDGHQQQADDLSRRYSETYLIHHGQEKDQAVYYDGYSGTVIRVVNLEGNTIRVDGEAEHQLSPLMPKVGYYNIQGVPTFLVKYPRKQWKRSLCSGIYVAYQTQSSDHPPPTRTNWSLVAKEVLNPQYVNLDDITNKLFAKIALNLDFAIAHNRHDVPVLLYKRYEIAMLNFNTRTVTITQPKLAQEIQDLFKYTGVKTWKLH